MHSAYNGPEISDVVVAFATDGFVHINSGFVCGEMIHFISQSSGIPANMIDFFEHFISDTDGKKWKISDTSVFLKKK